MDPGNSTRFQIYTLGIVRKAWYNSLLVADPRKACHMSVSWSTCIIYSPWMSLCSSICFFIVLDQTNRAAAHVYDYMVPRAWPMTIRLPSHPHSASGRCQTPPGQRLPEIRPPAHLGCSSTTTEEARPSTEVGWNLGRCEWTASWLDVTSSNLQENWGEKLRRLTKRPKGFPFFGRTRGKYWGRNLASDPQKRLRVFMSYSVLCSPSGSDVRKQWDVRAMMGGQIRRIHTLSRDASPWTNAENLHVWDPKNP